MKTRYPLRGYPTIAAAFLVALGLHCGMAYGLSRNARALYCIADFIFVGRISNVTLKNIAKEPTHYCWGKSPPRTMREYDMDEQARRLETVCFELHLEASVSSVLKAHSEYASRSYRVHFRGVPPDARHMTIAEYADSVRHREVVVPLLYFGGIFRREGYEWGLDYVDPPLRRMKCPNSLQPPVHARIETCASFCPPPEWTANDCDGQRR